MIEFVNEPVSVELQGWTDGTARPTAFAWRGCRYRIESWGRETDETRAGRAIHCYLIQTAGPETWELCQDKETAQWTLNRHWARRNRTL